MTRPELERRWLVLTRQTLPALAPTCGWPIRNDHCFQRVLLDTAYGGCWYDHIAGRPAYRHMSTEYLAAAVVLAEQLASGDLDLHRLNAQSLIWRGKRARVA